MLSSSSSSSSLSSDGTPSSSHSRSKKRLIRLARTIVKAYIAGFAVSTIPKLVFQFSSFRKNPSLLLQLLQKGLVNKTSLFLVVLFGGFQGLNTLFIRLWKKRERKNDAGDSSVQLNTKTLTIPSASTADPEELFGSPRSERDDEFVTPRLPLMEGGHSWECIDNNEKPHNDQPPPITPMLPSPFESLSRSRAGSQPMLSLTRSLSEEMRLNLSEKYIAPTFLAGIVSSLCAILVLPKSRRSDMALIVVVRAIDSLIEYRSEDVQKWLRSKLNLPYILIENADVALFTASAVEIMHAWFYLPDALPKSYNRWITKMSDIPHELPEVLRLFNNGKIVYGQSSEYNDYLKGVCIKSGLDPSLGDPSKQALIPCVVVHSGIETCTRFWAHSWWTSFWKAFKIYLPVHFLPRLLFRPKSFITHSSSTFQHILIGTVRSSAFLSTLIALIFTGVCTTRNTIKRDDYKLGPLLGSFMSGFSILFEKKSRRRELTLYVLPRAIGAFLYRLRQQVFNLFIVKLRLIQSNGWVHASMQQVFGNGGVMDLILWCGGMSYFLAGLVHRPASVREGIRGLLGFFICE